MIHITYHYGIYLRSLNQTSIQSFQFAVAEQLDVLGASVHRPTGSAWNIVIVDGAV